MIRCINKVRTDSGKILEYTLQDEKGQIIRFEAKLLRDKMKAGQIQVSNLKLTKDNRIISTEKEKKAVDKLLNRAVTLGLKIDEINTMDRQHCYVIYKTSEDAMLYIPENVTNMRLLDNYKDFEGMKSVRGTIEVIGGKNVITISNLFSRARARVIDFSKFKAKELKDVTIAFELCEAEQIYMSNVKIEDNPTCVTMLSGFNGSITLTKEMYQSQFNLITKRLSRNDFDVKIKVIDDEQSAIRVYIGEQVVYQTKMSSEELFKHVKNFSNNKSLNLLMSWIESADSIIKGFKNKVEYKGIYDIIYDKKSGTFINNTKITISNIDEQGVKLGAWIMNKGVWSTSYKNLGITELVNKLSFENIKLSEAKERHEV